MTRMLFLFLIMLIIPMVHSCVSSKNTLKRNDPLIGKIFDTTKNMELSFDTLIEKIHTFDVIYLSEKHDNPDHHKYQERIIQALIKKKLNPTIGFEFFAMDNTPDLLNFVDSGKVTHSTENEAFIENDLRKKLGWDTQSDESWAYYFNLLNIAKKNKLSVAGIDLSRSSKKRITRKGINGITALEAELIFSTHLDNDTYKDYMFSIFKAVHCGMGNENMQSRLYDTWVARNDKMALSISQLFKHTKGPVIIIIGGGHTSYGLGVIDRVRAINSNITQVNLDLSEINIHPSNLEDYLAPLDLEGFNAIPPSDYIWFTQRISYTDPCEEFKAILKRMKAPLNKE